ncbi:hypothetical protein INS49_004733 [Diaporthe citri]|uniref:uncharacterized protein n=1 Tax=Diaporthe citri TaxID=83186 RepID=UPI001C825953|nr:uncharacterized protein INS49_004733 [Diaporthe citri]KAG6354715.1 hypothetical protein INS49_004733 [Diaporthe citri]
MDALHAKVEFGGVMERNQYAANARKMDSSAFGLDRNLLNSQFISPHATTPAQLIFAAESRFLARQKAAIAKTGKADPFDRSAPGRNTVIASSLSRPESPDSTQGPGDIAVDRSSSNMFPQALSQRVLSLPSRPQTERNVQRSSSLTAPSTITFDEVFKSVRSKDSQNKHFIVEFPQHSSKWYILWCNKHDMNFGEYPFSSAGCHIDSEAHGHLPRTHENCISELGVLVLGCTSKRAESNNEAYKEALQGGYKPKQGNTKSHKKGRPRTSHTHNHGSIETKRRHNGSRPAGLFKPFEGIVNPVPGDVYQGAQHKPGRMEPQWWLVVRLPLRNW